MNIYRSESIAWVLARAMLQTNFTFLTIRCEILC